MAIEEQFDFLAIAEAAHVNLLAFPSRPGPMRHKVQNGFAAPPRLIIVENVLGKTARVQNAKLRADVGPTKRGRLAAIIETSPDERAAGPRPGGVVIPPFLGGRAVTRLVDIVGGFVGPGIFIDATRVIRAHFFGSNARFCGIGFVEDIQVRVVKVIETLHVNRR